MIYLLKGGLLTLLPPRSMYHGFPWMEKMETGGVIQNTTGLGITSSVLKPVNNAIYQYRWKQGVCQPWPAYYREGKGVRKRILFSRAPPQNTLVVIRSVVLIRGVFIGMVFKPPEAHPSGKQDTYTDLVGTCCGNDPTARTTFSVGRSFFYGGGDTSITERCVQSSQHDITSEHCLS